MSLEVCQALYAEGFVGVPEEMTGPRSPHPARTSVESGGARAGPGAAVAPIRYLSAKRTDH